MAETPEQLAVQGRMDAINESLRQLDSRQDLLRYRKLQIQLACLEFMKSIMKNLNQSHRQLLWASAQKWIDGIEPSLSEKQKWIRAAYVQGIADEPIDPGEDLAPYITDWFEIGNLLSQDKDDVILKHPDFNHFLVRIKDAARRDAQGIPKKLFTEDLNGHLKGFIKDINNIFKAPARRIDLTIDPAAENRPSPEDMEARRASAVELVGAVAEREESLEIKALEEALAAYREKLSEEEEAEELEEQEENKELEEFMRVAKSLTVASQAKFAKALAAFEVLDDDGDVDVNETQQRRQLFIKIIENLKEPINEDVFENSSFMSKLSSTEAKSLPFILRYAEKSGGKGIAAELFSLLNSAKINDETNEFSPLFKLVELLYISKQKNEDRRRELTEEFERHHAEAEKMKGLEDFGSRKEIFDEIFANLKQYAQNHKAFLENFIQNVSDKAAIIDESRADLKKLFQRNKDNKRFLQAFNKILEKFDFPLQKDFDPSQLIRMVQESNKRKQDDFQKSRLTLYNALVTNLQENLGPRQKKARPETPPPGSPVTPSTAPPPTKKPKLKMASMIEATEALEAESEKRLALKEEERRQAELKQRADKERETSEHRRREEEHAASERRAHELKEREVEHKRQEERRASLQADPRRTEDKDRVHELEQKRLREEKEKEEAMKDELKRLEELQRTQARERAALERKWEQESREGKVFEKRTLQQARFIKSEKFKAEAFTDKDKLKQADNLLTELNIYIRDLQAAGPRKKGFLTGTLLSDQEAKLEIAKQARANVLNLRESYTKEGKERLSYQGKSPEKFYTAITNAIQGHLKANKKAHGFALIDKGKLDKILHKTEDLLAGKKPAAEKKKKH